MGLLFIGIAFILFGLWGLYRIYDMRKNGVKTQAKVVNIKEKQVGTFRNQHDRNIPYFQYKSDGKTIESSYWQARNDSKYKVNDFVEIKYDPKKPDKFIILKDSGTGGIIALIGVGIFIALIGLAIALEW